MTIDYSNYIKWIHMLAWRTLDICELSKEERKVIGIFIGNVKNKKYISDTNILLAKVVGIIDEHLPIKPTALPVAKKEYSKEEKKEIRKGIRELHKASEEGTAVWKFCNRFLFSATGKRRTKTHSENRYWHARMTLYIHACKNRALPIAKQNNIQTTTRVA